MSGVVAFQNTTYRRTPYIWYVCQSIELMHVNWILPSIMTTVSWSTFLDIMSAETIALKANIRIYFIYIYILCMYVCMYILCWSSNFVGKMIFFMLDQTMFLYRESIVVSILQLLTWKLCICWFQVILDEAIVKLNPDFFWLGGGDIDLKLGIKTSEFINFVRPFIVSCSGMKWNECTYSKRYWNVWRKNYFAYFQW